MPSCHKYTVLFVAVILTCSGLSQKADFQDLNYLIERSSCISIDSLKKLIEMQEEEVKSSSQKAVFILNKSILSSIGKDVEELERLNKELDILLTNNKITSDEILIKSYNLKSAIFRLKEDLNSMEYWCKKALILQRKNSADIFGMADQYKKLGNLYGMKEEFDLSRIYFDSCLALIPFDNILAASTLNYIGAIYYFTNKYDSAIYYLDKSLNILDSLDCKVNYIEKSNNLGQLYFKLERYNKAEAVYRKTLNASKGLKMEYFYYTSLARLMRIYDKQNQCDSIDKYSAELIYYFSSIRDTYFSCSAYESASVCAYKSNEYQRALDYCYKILQFTGKDDSPFKVRAYLRIGNINKNKNSDEAAISYYRKAEKLALKKRQWSILKEVYEALVMIYEKKHNFKQSLEFYRKLKSCSDSINNIKVLKNVNEVEEKYQSKILSQEKEVVESQLEISELARSKQRILIFTALSGFAVTILLILLSGIKNREKRKRLQLIQQNLKNELTSLKAQIMAKNKVVSALDENSESNDKFSFRLKNDIIKELKLESDWVSFDAKFEEIWPDFMKKILKLNQEITQYELRYCALVKMGLNASEIASILYISLAGAKKSSWRIRKKIDIDQGIQLKQFLADL